MDITFSRQRKERTNLRLFWWYTSSGTVFPYKNSVKIDFSLNSCTHFRQKLTPFGQQM